VALALLSAFLSFAAWGVVPGQPPQVCIDNVCTASAAPASLVAPSSKRKWHPGHYVTLDGTVRRDNLASIKQAHFAQIAALASEPAVKGVQIMFMMSSLEGATAGDYTAGKALVREYLDRLAAAGNKQLMIWMVAAQFGGYGDDLSVYFPSYIVNSPGYGLTKGSNGLYMRTWQAATMDRFIALSKALGQAFDSHPNVEMVTFGETALSIVDGTDGYSSAQVEAQQKRYLTEVRASWSTTNLRLHANYFQTDALMIDLIKHAASNGAVVGGPDVIPSEDIQANRVFTGETGGVDYRGVIPFVAEVQSPSLGGHEGSWTPEQLYNHSMYGNAAAGIRATQPQYFVWLGNTWSGDDTQKWASGILPFIRTINGNVYSTTCPSAIKLSCILN
jgi:hypothetical protein